MKFSVSLLLVFAIGLHALVVEPCIENENIKCGGGGGPPPPGEGFGTGVCNKACSSDSSCSGTCPYCKSLSISRKECRADTCSMVCTSSSQCKGRCPVCFAAKCQQCQSDSHCRSAFGNAKPYCKRITVINRECRADTCSMFCTSSSECKGSCRKCRWFKCVSSGGGCFPGQSQVVLEGGEMKKLFNLRLGDTVMTVQNGELVPTMILGFLDKRVNKMTEYINLDMEGGKSLLISQTHAMFIQDKNQTVKSIMAQDAKLGDLVFVKTGQIINVAKIIGITFKQKTGAFVPLTSTGTLIVDGVLVSCYTNADHWVAHSALAPLRWWPNLLLDNEQSQDTEGLRTLPGLVRSLGRLLGLVKQDQSGSSGGDVNNFAADQMDNGEYASINHLHNYAFQNVDNCEL